VIRNLNLEGRLVIVADGDVELEGVNQQAGDGDLLTVVSRGRLRVTGAVRASIVAYGSVVFDRSVRIEGNFLSRWLQPGAVGIGHVRYPAFGGACPGGRR